MSKWNHNQLRDDLSIARDIKFIDMPLGSVWAGQYAKGISLDNRGTQIADAIMVRPSYTQFCVSIYEVKVSRADFLSDIRTEKWRGYLNHSHRFYFATPKGLVDEKEIPKEAGLIIRCKKTWRTIVQPEVRDIEIPYDTMMALVFRQQGGQHTWAQNYHPDYVTFKKYKKLLGKHMGQKIIELAFNKKFCPDCGIKTKDFK